MSIVLFICIGFVLYLGFYAVKAYRGEYKPQSICPSCHSIVTPDSRAQGSGGVEILLWLMFIVPGLIYTIWRGSRKIITCPVCHAANPIPLSTPAGRALSASVAKVLIFCALAVTAGMAQETAKVTFFREDQSMMKQMGQFKIDYAAAGARWSIYMDGVQLATLHRGHYITFTIPAGSHDFKTDRSVRVTVDVQPGSNLFLRPGIQRSENKLEAAPNFNVVACADYLDRTKHIKPVNPHDIFTGSTVQTSFEATCGAKEKAGE